MGVLSFLSDAVNRLSSSRKSQAEPSQQRQDRSILGPPPDSASSAKLQEIRQHVDTRHAQSASMIASLGAEQAAGFKRIHDVMMENAAKRYVADRAAAEAMGGGSGGGAYELRWYNATAESDPSGIHRLEYSTDGGTTWTAVTGADGVAI